ncbi:pyridoxal phosphate-dependent aminotransferase [Salinarimonas sp.]|uniref:pyridoxal phosphate-dependent aminotransferase n=1 Tax=Salinarimonas sp. TaxID=2766526 RepID=UPI0032D9933F
MDEIATTWAGRFPPSDIISLLDTSRRFNLAESTGRDLTMAELIELVGWDDVAPIVLGYGASAGAERLRRVVAEMSGVAPDTVLATTGTALAIYLLAIELCRPGDEVALFSPCFPPTRDTLIAGGVRITEFPLAFERGFRIDLEAFAARLSPTTRLVSIATPQNPSGVAIDAGAMRAVLDRMAERAPDALLFVDETYRFATYGDAQPPESFAGLDPRVVTAASVSKAFGAPGLRVGWMTVGDPGLRERLKSAKMNIVISGSPLDEHLAALLLERREAVLAPRRRLLAEGLEMVARWQGAQAALVDWVRPDGGALCCIRLREEAVDAAGLVRFRDSLPRRELLLAPGPWFGADDRCFRLGFGHLPIAVLPDALEALGQALRDAAGR